MKRFLQRYISLLLLCCFVTIGAHAKRIINRTVVIVNDGVILKSDIQAFRQRLKSKSFQELFGGIDSNVLDQDENVVQLLIDETIINQQVKKLELAASTQEVDGQITAIAKRNGISQEQLLTRLTQLGTTIDEYKSGIKRQIERRNLIEREIKPTLEVSDEQLQHFYAQSAAGGDAEAQYEIAHILITGKNSRARAERVWAIVSKNPQQFNQSAKEYSDDSSTADSGGKLGFFSTSSLSKEFLQAVPKTPIGQITRPLKTSIGYHIVKVLQVRKGDFSSLSAETKARIRNALLATEVEKKLKLWLERKKAESYVRFSERKKL